MRYDVTEANDLIVEAEQSRHVMTGINHHPQSSSSRLQRIQIPFPLMSDSYRYPSNPAIASHPDRTRRRPSEWQDDYLLSVQIATASFHRTSGEKVTYHDRDLNWAVKHVSMTLSIEKIPSSHGSPEDQFQLVFQDEQDFPAFHEIDMRMMNFNETEVIAYGKPNEANTFLDWTRTGPHYEWKARARTQYTFKDNVDAVERPADLWIEQKNWMAVVAQDKLYFVPHMYPFMAVDCGLPDVEGWKDCKVHAYQNLVASNLPLDASHWRGSTPFLPLSGSPHLVLSMIHQRSSKSLTKAGERFKDRYTHRFVLLNTEKWQMVAFSDPFAFFAHYDDVEWFEFVMGLAATSSNELVITFGFNDQEPWLAILPMRLAILSLQPVFPSDSVLLEELQDKWH